MKLSYADTYVLIMPSNVSLQILECSQSLLFYPVFFILILFTMLL